MKLPIMAYGQSVLRKKGVEITPGYPDLQTLIDDMWETLYVADGCGLAAPQVNHPVRLFIVDSLETYLKMEEEDRKEFFDGDQGIKETFINAKILEYSDDYWIEEEGCLSIPGLSEDVERPWSITIEYLDRNFLEQKKTFSGTTARMIQHEYDHTDGKLYLDHVRPIRKKLLKGKLQKITDGDVRVNYAMKFIK